MTFRICALLAAGALACLAAKPGEDWRISYFYDKVQQTFNIADLACPSAGRCVAAGAIEEEGKLRPHSASTSDGGGHWMETLLEEPPDSLYFLNDSLGWMVTDRALWQTRNSGVTWKKLYMGKNLLRVWFVSPERGWAVGGGIFRVTSDGGVHWTDVPETAKIPADLGAVTFEYVHFNDAQYGVVVGEAAPFGRPEENVWLRPGVVRVRNPPSVIVSLHTADGGNTWTPQILGRHQTILAAAFPSPENAWMVFGPAAPTDVFSDVTRVAWTSRAARMVFHLGGALVSDLGAGRDGSAIVAAIEVPGKLADIPIPGRIRILSGSSFSELQPETVDYRAVARKITLASTPDGRWFAATDTGMILRREKQ